MLRPNNKKNGFNINPFFLYLLKADSAYTLEISSYQK